MVLIHGFASSTLVWSKVFLELAASGFRVIALDMLGYGYSGKPTTTGWDPARTADEVDHYLRRVAAERRSQQELTDLEADEARVAAPDIV